MAKPGMTDDSGGEAAATSLLLTNDGRELQEKLGPTTPGRWSVIGLPDDGQ